MSIIAHYTYLSVFSQMGRTNVFLPTLFLNLKVSGVQRETGSPHQPMEVVTAVVYDASRIHPTAYRRGRRFLNLAGAKFPKPLRFRKLGNWVTH